VGAVLSAEPAERRPRLIVLNPFSRVDSPRGLFTSVGATPRGMWNEFCAQPTLASELMNEPIEGRIGRSGGE